MQALSPNRERQIYMKLRRDENWKILRFEEKWVLGRSWIMFVQWRSKYRYSEMAKLEEAKKIPKYTTSKSGQFIQIIFFSPWNIVSREKIKMMTLGTTMVINRLKLLYKNLRAWIEDHCSVFDQSKQRRRNQDEKSDSQFA